MDQNRIRTELISVLESIQCDSGYARVTITGSTCPLRDLEGFDSKIWPYAIGMLAKLLKVKIEDDKNIYLSPDGRRKLSIDESAKMIAELLS